MSELLRCDVCIIGGGAAGTAAAITAARMGASVIIAEKCDKPLKKVAASGNGRCNIANAECENLSEVLDFFESIGIYTVKEDEGRLYPCTKHSSSVTEALNKALEREKVKIICNMAVSNISRTENGNFIVSDGNTEIICSRLLIAAGGKAGPSFGTTGDGYAFAKKLGHKVKTPVPVLTSLCCEEDIRHMRGIRAEGKVSLLKDGITIREEKGEIQFTEEGLSGICIFNLSRYVRLDMTEGMKKAFSHYSICVDFAPEISREETERRLLVNRNLDGLAAEDIFMSMVRRPLAELILEKASIKKKKAAELTDNDIRKLAEIYKSCSFGLNGAKGWNKAQCTAGGVDMGEIDISTMESLLVPGLYFAGEVTDYDGPCGGFNLFNAWYGGIKAGRAIADVY